MDLVLDLHLHSKYSRAVSPRMNLSNMYLWGRKKGLNILSVTDFTHPIWLREVQSQLEEIRPGIYRLKNEEALEKELGGIGAFASLGPYFMLSVEVSSIYTENGTSHRIHNLIFAPNFETVAKINKEFLRMGFNLSSDGRPIFGLSARNLTELLLGIDRKIALIPCHAWTPWFSLYGSRSGYDAIADCFGDYTKYIFAVETGLSSDPSNNWRIKELETRSIVSFSDAHSMQKMGREATVLQKVDPKNKKITLEDLSYDNILNSFVRGKERIFKIGYTIEFYPEEGKYHYTGHRNCGISYSPEEDRSKGTLCPVCGRDLTVGVMHRVEELAQGTPENFTYKEDENGVVWVEDKDGKRPKYVSLVPLLEVLGEVYGTSPGSVKVESMFETLVTRFGTEHEILLRTSLENLREVGGKRVEEAIDKVRHRNISIVPGFDGEYGKVSIWREGEEREETKKDEEQMGLGI